MNSEENLESQLQRLASRQRRFKLWRSLMICWGGLACITAVLLLLERATGWGSPLALPLVVLCGLLAAVIMTTPRHRQRLDLRALASQIESLHPELNGRLLTAVQQRPADGVQLNYLQQRLVEEALLHGQQNNWAAVTPKWQFRAAQAGHWLALGLLVLLLCKLPTTEQNRLIGRLDNLSIKITPGDTILERGSSLVVLARFTGPLPSAVELVLSANHPGSGQRSGAQRIALTKSLADPIFGASVPEISSDLLYHLEYAGQRSREFKVRVFEFPRLERADVDLSFPEYTSQPPKHIDDTRRLSAVEGSFVNLTLQLNKPVATARLVPRDREATVIPLLVESNRPVAALKQFNLTASKTYDLQLVDLEGRTNKTPAQFIFAALTNRTPEFRLASPRGDLRPSPLEEISFEGTVWDDFGVKAFGLAYVLPGEEATFFELGRDVPGKEKRSFQYTLRLEELGLEPDQVVAWFPWADDLGPDGQVRRTTGDLYFAEVRPFDEIFREGQQPDGGDGADGQSPPQGSRSARLVELQKQIISATWNLQRQHGASPKTTVSPPARLPAPQDGKPGPAPQSNSKRGGPPVADQCKISDTELG